MLDILRYTILILFIIWLLCRLDNKIGNYIGSKLIKPIKFICNHIVMPIAKIIKEDRKYVIETEMHYHCDICEVSYSTKEESEQCFINHSKEKQLIWVAKEVSYMKSYTYNLFERIDKILNKNNIEN